MSINSRLRAIYIIDHRKAFCRKRISESSCVRKETVDTEIFIAPRNDNKKIMHSTRITSEPLTRIRKWNQLSSSDEHQGTRVIPIERLKLATFLRWPKGSREAASVGPVILYTLFCSFSNLCMHCIVLYLPSVIKIYIYKFLKSLNDKNNYVCDAK